MSRPQLTPAQLDGARAMLAELRRLYEMRLSCMAVGLGVLEIADAHALPLPAALLSEKGGDMDSPGSLANAIAETSAMIERAQVVPAELKAAA
jgi:hypothetical protein